MGAFRCWLHVLQFLRNCLKLSPRNTSYQTMFPFSSRFMLEKIVLSLFKGDHKPVFVCRVLTMVFSMTLPSHLYEFICWGNMCTELFSMFLGRKLWLRVGFVCMVKREWEIFSLVSYSLMHCCASTCLMST